MFLSHPDHIMIIHRVDHDARVRSATFARLKRALRRGRRARPAPSLLGWMGSPPPLPQFLARPVSSPGPWLSAQNFSPQ